METCLLVPEAANRIRAFLERRAAEKDLAPRDRRRRGLMRRAGIQMARTTGEILITLETERGDPPALLDLARETARAFPRVVGIVRREYDRHDRSVGASILHGRDHLFEEVDGDRMKIPGAAFFQPNATAWSVLRSAVLRELAPGPDDDRPHLEQLRRRALDHRVARVPSVGRGPARAPRLRGRQLDQAAAIGAQVSA